MTASLSLPGIPPALADELRLDASASAASNVAREAIATYNRATDDYYDQRAGGGIVRASGLDDGVKWEAVTPDGARVLYAWQRARSELAQAVRLRRSELRR